MRKITKHDRFLRGLLIRVYGAIEASDIVDINSRISATSAVIFRLDRQVASGTRRLLAIEVLLRKAERRINRINAIMPHRLYVLRKSLSKRMDRRAVLISSVLSGRISNRVGKKFGKRVPFVTTTQLERLMKLLNRRPGKKNKRRRS